MIISTAKKILLIEPETLLADLTSFRLELLAYPIETVTTAADGLSAIESNKPDLVICNSRLPDFDGLELVSKLRTEWTAEQLPILIISFESALEIVERAFLAGAQDYLVIPFDPQVLEDKIQRILDAQHSLAHSR
jgi:DNA-binding response OmpR family regulator